MYFVVIPHLDVKWAVDGNLYSPPSFAVGYRMKDRGVEGYEVWVNYCCLLTLHLAEELEIDFNRIGLHLCLPRHCDKDEQDGDDGFLHNHFVLLLYFCIIYTTFSRKYLVRGIHFHVVTVSESHSEPQRYRKSHEKTPDKTEKMLSGVKV